MAKKISYKMNIGLYFFFSSLIIIMVVTAAFYYFVKQKLYSEIIQNFQSTVFLGASGIDTDAFKRLTEKINENKLTTDSIDSIEQSDDYKKIYNYLNEIRNTKKDLFIFVYTLIPGKDETMARFVVDADVLSLKKESAPDEDISHFGLDYDISSQPVTQKALKEKENCIETQFIYDKDYKVYSMMGFAPIFDKNTGEFLGILGADISNKNIAIFLRKILVICFVIMILAIFFVIVISAVLANSISKPIILLSDTVKRFSERDFEARADFQSNIKETANLIENFNLMAVTIQDYNTYMQDLNTSYERFVPLEFLTFLSKNDIMQVKLGDQIQKDMAIMFSDIRSFSTLSESMTPKQTFDFLNSYLQRIGPIIRKNGGFIDKYLGDGLMALFPKNPDDAIIASIEMRKELAQYNRERKAQGLFEINAGIGIHTGTLMLGIIGDEKRMQGTVISDSVNLAARLDTLTKDFGVSTLITKELFNRLNFPDKYKYRFLGNTLVKGKTESIVVFEIYDADTNELIELKDTTKSDLHNALYLFNIQKYDEAKTLFSKIHSVFPNDAVASLFIEKCSDML
ncbi:MAG: hypothetical protein A2015_15430 [Spirochaetes bacterium GWF1_31_7]|nr:MAG: hypothetical protein A2Y30_11850 [Spirochaetes bacterium GWE1_32_154]OHD47257.1 MAG: hypothetical protein A2Y29_02865 [Spirochaetes bacterium GWE2_31_10]OHD52129.1 MAG: hypothetical protein A2015_15430 [Spirochaetes bacterium GWF1_31_7]OHD77667.1 MAG: hypothetical protein A2355_00265 [Spirochaetes bacterium RIFOXYB1_FULL_32_8]